MSEIVNKIDYVYSLIDLDKIRLEIIIALSSMQLNQDYKVMQKFYAAYVKMVDRLNGFKDNSLRESERKAQSDLEVLTHAADLYLYRGEEAFEWASKKDPPTESNLLSVRRFYRECIHGSAVDA